MNKSLDGKYLLGAGVILALGLLIIRAGGTLAMVLYGAAALLIILGVLGMFGKKK